MCEVLDRAFNVAVLQIVSRLFPTGFDVSETAPDTFESLRSHVESTGRMLVWSGASDQTIFGDANVNHAFRAWHDWCHLAGNHDFSPEGERAAAELQISHIRQLYTGETADRFAKLVWCEVVGQVEFYTANGGTFPTDQIAFAREYLAIV